MTDLSRRSCLTATLGISALSMAGCSSSSSALDLQDPKNAFIAYVKLLGSLKDTTIYTSFEGTLSGVLPNQAPQVICRYQGLARSDWKTKPDGSFTKQSFDIGFFGDLETGEVVDEIINPLTGETVRPLHFKYGGGPAQDINKEVLSDIRWSEIGGNIWLSEAGGGAFPHPMDMQKWPRESSGEKLFYRSETDYVTTRRQLADNQVSSADQTLFWSSLLSWEPWLLMGQTPGFTMWRGVGVKLKTSDQIPESMRAYIAKVQPNYLDAAPPWQKREGSFDRFMSLRKPS